MSEQLLPAACVTRNGVRIPCASVLLRLSGFLA